MIRRLICLAGFGVCTVGVSAPALATTITFDSAFTSPAPAVDHGVVREYSTPSPAPPTTFTTQGFTFGGFNGLLPALQPHIDILQDASLCPVSCNAGDGSDYLLGHDTFSLTRQGGGNFALSSLQAALVFGPAGCPACDGGSGLTNATSIRITAFRNGVSGSVVSTTFVLTSAFQTFTLLNAQWQNVTFVLFEGLNSANQPVALSEVYGLDNVNASAVPEPASLILLGTGLLAVRRRFKS